ncbi:MAG: hypothetical protein DRI69_03670 [Bacteroidetes bacterium]|nr:MAG: hypothetical protein DRI69_03670 [Bacteroidota bacterium]
MNIDKHIQENRESFDHMEPVPSEAIWIGIQQNLRTRQRRKLFIRYAAAAAIICTFSAPFLFNLSNPTIPENKIATPPLILAQEKQYYQLASDKKDELDFRNLDPAIYGEIFSELDILDSMYMDLKAELTNSPDAERAIGTAIRFHERRLRILELLEKEIENQKRIEEHESTIKI